MVGAAPQVALHGRSAELRALAGAIDRARSGEFAGVVLEGEPGIGKTRLLTEGLLMARQRGLTVAEATADEMQRSRPFGPIAAALGCVRSAADPQRSAIADLLATHAHAAAGEVTISSDPGLQFRAVDAFADLVESLARRGPLVIALDDVQWADPSSLLALSAIGGAAIGLPVALIVCCRPLPRSPSLRRAIAALEDLGVERLPMRHLAGEDVRELVAEALGGEPDRAVLSMVDAAAGNPLFLMELLRSARIDGLDTGTTPDGTRESLPPSLKLIVLRRISELPDPTVHMLKAASLLGSNFSAAELAAVTGRPILDLGPAIETAITAAVFVDDGELLAFRHDVIRSAIYDDIPSSLRRASHRDAARRLAAIGAGSARVAEQFARGAVVGDEEAVEYLVAAARETVAAAPQTAADFLKRAAELTVPSDPRRDLLLTERADCLMSAGRVADAVADCRELLGRAHRPDADAPARLRLGAALLVNGQPAEALRELDAVAASAGSDDQRAAALAEAGTARMWLGDFDGADRTATRARAVAATAADHRAATAALATRSVVACMRGEIARGMELGDEALAVADGSPGLVGHGYPVYATRGWILMEADDLDGARRMLGRGRKLCEEVGVRWPLATYQAYLAVERFLAGQWDDAAAELEAGIGFAEEEGVTFGLKPSMSALALIRLHRGDLIGAREAVDDASAVSDRGSRFFDYRAAWARALVLEADGDEVGALQALAERWRPSVDARTAADFPVVGPDLVRMARAANQIDLAEEVAEAVMKVAAENRVRSYTAAALRCTGLLADDAAAMSRAVEEYAAAPRRVEAALTCEETADIAMRRHDSALAREMLGRAAEIFTDLDATRCLARIDKRYRRLGVRRGARGPRRRPQWGWASLTPTERTIADLVAEGLTNPQIAERLYISRRTVQTHVSHIFAKVGISSRAQLAAGVARRRPGDHDARSAASPHTTS